MGESMPPGAVPPTGSPLAGRERALDAPRYLAALRRGVWLMVLIVVPLTLDGARALADPAEDLPGRRRRSCSRSSGSVAATRRAPRPRRQKLATIQRLLTSHDVLERPPPSSPARRRTRSTTRSTASVDDAANIISIKAQGRRRGRGRRDRQRRGGDLPRRRRRAAERQRFAKARRELEQAARPPAQASGASRRRSGPCRTGSAS